MFLVRILFASFLWAIAYGCVAIFEKANGVSLFSGKAWGAMETAAPLLAASGFVVFLVLGAATFFLKHRPMDRGDPLQPIFVPPDGKTHFVGDLPVSPQADFAVFTLMKFTSIFSLPAFLAAWFLDSTFTPKLELAFLFWLFWIELAGLLLAMKFRMRLPKWLF